MARQSAAALSVVSATPDYRLPTPRDLNEAEAAVWQEVTATKPADWFGEDGAPVLKEYVRAAVMCDLLGGRLNEALKAGATDVKTLLDLRDRESRRMVILATKLRLTQQSRYTPLAAATAVKRAGGRRPWQS